MRRRLHWQIFRALVATGVMCLTATMAAAWLWRGRTQEVPRMLQDMGAFILDELPQDREGFERGLHKRALRLHASLAVWDRHGQLVARAGREIGPTRITGRETRLFQPEHVLRLRLADGRTLAISFDDEKHENHARYFVMGVGMVMFTLMLGSYLAAKRITRRLEKLERGVTRFGEGSLDVRVHVRGRDEIARLAFAFNRSFDRIAGLLKQQRRMLQSASHELRSPLARLRMALELATEPELPHAQRERLRGDATRDIEELDALIGDLLLAGRLADTELPKDFCEVSLLEIVQSEAPRVSATYQAPDDLVLQGNGRMLRSLVRNLLENARRHGRDPIHATLAQEDTFAVIRVDDAGDGVTPDDRERIFEPFYRPVGHREGKDGGVGLGLSLVKTIAQHHGGSVRYVPSTAGSSFEVRLPGARVSTPSPVSAFRGPSARPARP
jgi:two-component system, OmpR family, sensor kinase